ncbi:MAG: efflux RND transporter periplasmic adaptor subunit [Acidobacteriia bacterium]|nr:efflux RND transporter periplasmic adaptor subunit [Terriglobia bacterium]
MKKSSRFVEVLVGAIVIALVAWAFVPKPIKVEKGHVERGSLRVTVDEEAETRVHDRFEIAAPVTGRLQRIELHAADPVEEGQLLAQIEPLPLDPRERAELLARVESTQATRREAEANVERIRTEYEQARRTRERASKLAASGVISHEELEFADTAATNSSNALDAAKFRARAAAYEVQVAKAGLLALAVEHGDKPRIITLRSPIRGHVLRLLQQSERVVSAGTPILQVGHPSQLEIVSDVLSTEAVKVKPGDPVLIENWGGDMVLRAKVRTVESSGFTKISALGVEEQRVNVVMDFVDSPTRLGDGYRVDVRIIVWEGNDVLKVPASAVFRRGQGWSVFVVENGRARARTVEIGHRNALEAELVKGVGGGEEVILHPGNQVSEGTRLSH